MHIYRYLGKGNLDAFCASLRRQGYTASVETINGAAHLVTDYTVTGINFTWIGRR